MTKRFLIVNDISCKSRSFALFFSSVWHFPITGYLKWRFLIYSQIKYVTWQSWTRDESARSIEGVAAAVAEVRGLIKACIKPTRNKHATISKVFKFDTNVLCTLNRTTLTFDINCHCDSIIDFFANSYIIVQIYHAKSFKMKYIRSLYLNFLFRYS